MIYYIRLLRAHVGQPTNPRVAGWVGSVVWVCQPGQVVGLVDLVKMANLVEMVAESEPGKD